MIVDAHHHLWQRPERYQWLADPALAPIRRDFGVPELRAALAGTGVRHTVLVEGGRGDAAEAGELLALARTTEEIAGVVAWADLTDPGLAGTLARYRAGPDGQWLVGVRAHVQDQADPDYLGRPDARAGLAVVAAAGLTFDLLVRVDQLPGAAAAARAVPGLRFVLDHLGKPRIRDGAAGLAAWRAGITPLAAAPNTVAKLSGLVTEAHWAQWTVADLRPFVLTAVELFGPERLMFGSDWPVCLLAAPGYAAVRQALDEALGDALSAAERTQVYAGTAARSYRLSC